MKKLIIISVLTSLVLTFSSCKKEEIIVQKDFLTKQYINVDGVEYANTFEYNDDNLLKTLNIEIIEFDELGDHVKATFNYDEDNNITSMNMIIEGLEYQPINDFVYEDNKVTVYSKVDPGLGIALTIAKIEYFFDDKNQLIKMDSYMTNGFDKMPMSLVMRTENTWENGNNVLKKTSFYDLDQSVYNTTIQSYEFDNMNCAEESIAPSFVTNFLSVVSKNNIIKHTISSDLMSIEEVTSFQYEYNDNGYPILRKSFIDGEEVGEQMHYEYITIEVTETKD
jgi:uncharacterized lipoprotein YehR (DUF1307 family)